MPTIVGTNQTCRLPENTPPPQRTHPDRWIRQALQPAQAEVTHTDIKGTILLVEDDTAMRGALAEILLSEGYAVQQATDGEIALKRLRTGPLPDLILLDLMMPGMDGWQFRRLQLQQPAWTHIPVVILSGIEESEREVADLQADGCLFKPIEVPRLLRVIHGYCN